MSRCILFTLTKEGQPGILPLVRKGTVRRGGYPLALSALGEGANILGAIAPFTGIAHENVAQAFPATSAGKA